MTALDLVLNILGHVDLHFCEEILVGSELVVVDLALKVFSELAQDVINFILVASPEVFQGTLHFLRKFFRIMSRNVHDLSFPLRVHHHNRVQNVKLS